MKLNTFTDYALRTLLYLAAHPQRKGTIADIAKAYDISESHLTKVVHYLGKEGWVQTVRGKGGGLALVRSFESINIGALVRQAEDSVVLAECFEKDGGCCAITEVCRLKNVLFRAQQAFYAVLDGVTLADLVGPGKEVLAKVLFMPRLLKT
jgi:Rrf2 family transcriptional regulator, nitric oxide-sensitive transcriptional repressor